MNFKKIIKLSILGLMVCSLSSGSFAENKHDGKEIPLDANIEQFVTQYHKAGHDSNLLREIVQNLKAASDSMKKINTTNDPKEKEKYEQLVFDTLIPYINTMDQNLSTNPDLKNLFYHNTIKYHTDTALDIILTQLNEKLGNQKMTVLQLMQKVKYDTGNLDTIYAIIDKYPNKDELKQKVNYLMVIDLHESKLANHPSNHLANRTEINQLYTSIFG